MKKPKSKVLQRGYINIYSSLNHKEEKQLHFSRKYNKLNPNWDNTNILLCKKFEAAIRGKKHVVVLDAGCGHGNYVIDEFRKKINWACGVDLSKKATEKNICLDEIKYSSLEKLPYRDNSFDVVLSLWVLEHLKNPQKVLGEIKRVLKPGGTFIFATPNKRCWLVQLKRFFSPKFNAFFVKFFYGRAKESVFPAYYKANCTRILKKLLKNAGFAGAHLTINFDPGYTSFNDFTFKISVFSYQLLEGKKLETHYSQHIVGTAKTKT